MNTTRSIRLVAVVLVWSCCACNDTRVSNDEHYPYWLTVRKLKTIGDLVTIKQPVESFDRIQSLDELVAAVRIPVPGEGGFIDDVRFDGWGSRFSYAREGDPHTGMITVRSTSPESKRYGSLSLSIELKKVDGASVLVVERTWESSRIPK